MRLARAYAFGVALSFAALVALMPSATQTTFNRYIVDALRSASWIVAGLSALSAARDLERRDDTDGFAALFALRGAGQRERAWSRVIAGAARIALGVSIPAFAVLAVSALKWRGPALGPWLALWTALIVVYATALGATLSALSRGSAMLFARHARFLLVGVVFVPELLRVLAGWPLPSLPSACSSFLDLAQTWARGSA
jgi:hypothetical protein